MDKLRKLTYKETGLLKALEEVVRNKQAQLQSIVSAIDKDEQDAKSKAQREAADTARGIHQEAEGEKKTLDSWKQSELDRVENEYQARLMALRSKKRECLDKIEMALNGVVTAIAGTTAATKTKMEAEFQAFLRENQKERDRIRNGEKPDATSGAGDVAQ